MSPELGSASDRETMTAVNRMLALLAIAGTACSPGTSGSSVASEDDHQPVIVSVDFAAELVEVESSGWQILEDGGARSEILATVGGPKSQHEVGPGRLLLADGSGVEVEAGTPGGSYCTGLGTSHPPMTRCMVVGAYRPGTTVAAWFATVWASDSPAGPMVDIVELTDRTALLRAGADTFFEATLADGLAVRSCPDGAAPTGRFGDLPLPLFGVVDGDRRVVVIECGFGD